MSTPHFDLPFRFDGNSAAIVEQDTIDDIVNCVIGSLSTHIGWRPEQPTFGIDDLTFESQPLDLSAIVAQVAKDEPRAALFIQQFPDRFDELVASVLVNVSARGASQ